MDLDDGGGPTSPKSTVTGSISKRQQVVSGATGVIRLIRRRQCQIFRIVFVLHD